MKFRLKSDATSIGGLKAKAGEIVYSFKGCDYGLASDDTRNTGVEHISVTLNPQGGTPSFTHPWNELEAIE